VNYWRKKFYNFVFRVKVRVQGSNPTNQYGKFTPKQKSSVGRYFKIFATVISFSLCDIVLKSNNLITRTKVK
jgi:hypothetical protein